MRAGVVLDVLAVRNRHDRDGAAHPLEAQGADALPHPGQAHVTLWLVLLRAAGGQAASVVSHLKVDSPVARHDPDLDGGGIGVPCYVGQRLLHRAEQRQLRFRRERRQ